MMAGWFSPLAYELPLVLAVALATHLVISFGQTVMHNYLGHSRLGGKFYRTHINFHHTFYNRHRLASPRYEGDEEDVAPFFLVPVAIVATGMFFLLPRYLFVTMIVAAALSFAIHVWFDRSYHVQGSFLERFAWFRRKRQLHFVHHLHANTNFAVVDFFWDRVLGTYRDTDRHQG